MNSQLKIAYIQTHLEWENPEQNRYNFEEKITAISTEVDVIILPEMFTTGFTMNAASLAEDMTGKTVFWMKKLAQQKNSAIVGSLIIKENNNYYNRLLFILPDGKIHTYNKRHTFTLAGEDKVFTSGSKKNIVTYKGWKICPLVCYDLRFPVWSRNTQDYDLLLYVANWPKKRITAWDTLLKARAIENMTYCIGVNRVGIDGKGFEYNGNSVVYDALGTVLNTNNSDKDYTEIVTLNRDTLNKHRDRFKFLNDRDQFTLE